MNFDQAAAQYIDGALVLALVMTAVVAVYRIVAAIRRHCRRANELELEDDGVITAAELDEREAPSSPAGPSRLPRPPRRGGPVGSTGPLHGAQP